MDVSVENPAVALPRTSADSHGRASQQDGSYPRPQLVRPTWSDLSGPWKFGFDDDNVGLDMAWHTNPPFDRSIIVPFPPESRASGIHETGFHPVVWYQRDLTTDELRESGFSPVRSRVILHFGAVDYRAMIWLNGVFLGEHEGGHVPFSFDVTNAIDFGVSSQSLVVRAEDDPLDLEQPRGKQDWEPSPHGIWYHRTTGIWQPVWLESVPELHIAGLSWIPNLADRTIETDIILSVRPPVGTTVSVQVSYEGQVYGEVEVHPATPHIAVSIPLIDETSSHNFEHLMWSPRVPRLFDATVSITGRSGVAIETVASYLGLRSVASEGGRFVLNGRPYYVRSVLSQGYWPDSLLASPSADALRDEVQLIKDMGFNAARVHQKIEDPRFLFWADRLGLMVWGENPSAFDFSTTSARRMIAEWTSAVVRDISHPSLVTWVPLNESWGVHEIVDNETMKQYARTLFHLTKTLDGSRPVVSNDGWEQLDSDIWTIHDYEESGPILLERYGSADAVADLFVGYGPARRRLRLSDEPDRGQPVMVTEFGGIRWEAGDTTPDAWGYSDADSVDDFQARLQAVLVGIQDSPVLAGFCYTQLTDTEQEANGLATADRVPKLPIETLRALILHGEETLPYDFEKNAVPPTPQKSAGNQPAQ